MRKSKYYGLQSGKWICTHVGVARVQPVYSTRLVNGKRVRNKYPGHQTYYYEFTRMTSDLKAFKTIRLSAAQARLVLQGLKSPEDFAAARRPLRSCVPSERISYTFCD